MMVGVAAADTLDRIDQEKVIRIAAPNKKTSDDRQYYRLPWRKPGSTCQPAGAAGKWVPAFAGTAVAHGFIRGRSTATGR